MQHERLEDESRYRIGVPRVQEWRAVCACGWRGDWRDSLAEWGGAYADDQTGEDWDLHWLSAPAPKVSAFPRGESTQAFMQRTDPVSYQQCRDAGRIP